MSSKGIKCYTCLKSFPARTITQHRDTCVLKKCIRCREKYLKTTKHNCEYATCTRCGRKHLKATAHNCIPRFKRCSMCKKNIKMTKFETHHCQKKKNCSQCGKNFLVDEFGGRNCIKQKCTKCRKNIPRSEFVNHNCEVKKLCMECRRYWLVNDYDNHPCEREMCRRCLMVISKADFSEHVCEERKECNHCHCKFPASKLKDHGCQRRRCSKCYKSMPKSDFDKHKCDRHMCRKCNALFSNSTSDMHVCDVENKQRCLICGRSVKIQDMKSHQLNCPMRIKRAQGLYSFTIGCKEPMAPPSSKCAKHRGKSRRQKHMQLRPADNSKALIEDYKFRRAMQETFLNLWWGKQPVSLQGLKLNAEIETLCGQIREHRENNTFPILDAWRIHRQLYEERSPKLLFYDLEMSFSYKPGTRYRWIFSICLRDAARNTILHTRVSQGMTVNQLYNASDEPGWEGEVSRWYSERSDKMTSGMEWHQIAETMKKAGIDQECYSMEQSHAFCDHDNLYRNLREIGMHHLVPKRKHVLRLIPTMKLAFPQFKLNHSLSYMHRLLCPDDRNLIARAHTEDADEEMLYIQAGIYFKGTRNNLKPSGIQGYLDGAVPKYLGNLKHTFLPDKNGDLLVSPNYETIKDMEELISDVSHDTSRFSIPN